MRFILVGADDRLALSDMMREDGRLEVVHRANPGIDEREAVYVKCEDEWGVEGLKKAWASYLFFLRKLPPRDGIDTAIGTSVPAGTDGRRTSAGSKPLVRGPARVQKGGVSLCPLAFQASGHPLATERPPETVDTLSPECSVPNAEFYALRPLHRVQAVMSSPGCYRPEVMQLARVARSKGAALSVRLCADRFGSMPLVHSRHKTKDPQ